jgi:dsDNA-binding SOS-regulon protein
LSRQLIVLTQSAPAVHDQLRKRLTLFLAEDIDDHDCVVIEAACENGGSHAGEFCRVAVTSGLAD